MASEFDMLEEEIVADMRKTYSEIVIDHAMNPRNVGSMSDADGFASITGPCGDTMAMWLRVKDNRLRRVTFLTDGCGTTVAAGSMLTEMAKEKAISEILRITPQEVLDVLGGLPEESKHCVLLAVITLREAIKEYLTCQREPWRKAYRRQ